MTTASIAISGTEVVKTRTRRERWLRRGPLLPALIFTVVITQLPFVVTLVVSVLRWNVLQPGSRSLLGFGNYQGFAGLDNYKVVFTDDRMRAAVVNTVVLTLSVVIGSLLVGLALAILLDRKFPGRGLARTLCIAPFLIMPVASSLLWKHIIYNPEYGLINGTLNWVWHLFGSDQGPQIDWVTHTPMLAVVVSLIWQWCPFMMLILLAGLQAQPADSLEAAGLDGAGPVQTFRYITFPHMRRYLELAGILGCIYVVQSFDAVYTITSGGPGTATTNFPYEIYLTMFRKYDYGEAAAAGVVVVAMMLVVFTFAMRVFSSLVTEEGR
jgi:sorbitol/mannitol transport system permease protein